MSVEAGELLVPQDAKLRSLLLLCHAEMWIKQKRRSIPGMEGKYHLFSLWLQTLIFLFFWSKMKQVIHKCFFYNLVYWVCCLKAFFSSGSNSRKTKHLQEVSILTSYGSVLPRPGVNFLKSKGQYFHIWGHNFHSAKPGCESTVQCPQIMVKYQP